MRMCSVDAELGFKFLTCCVSISLSLGLVPVASEGSSKYWMKLLKHSSSNNTVLAYCPSALNTVFVYCPSA
jgi:hypothetical protein